MSSVRPAMSSSFRDEENAKNGGEGFYDYEDWDGNGELGEAENRPAAGGREYGTGGRGEDHRNQADV